MKKTVKIGLITICVVIGVIATIFYTMKPLDVDTMITETQDVYDYIEEDGTIISDHTVAVTPMANATVTEVLVKNGDNVESGQPLITLDADAVKVQMDQLSHQMTAVSEEKNLSLTGLKYQMRQERLTIAKLEADMVYAKESFEQSEALFQTGAISETAYKAAKQTYEDWQNSLDQANARLASLNAQYNQMLEANGNRSVLEAQLEALKLNLSYATVTAKASGVLTNFDVNVGDFVTSAMPIGEIIDPTAYKVLTYVLTEDAYNLEPGQEVVLEIKRNGEDITYEGTIYTVEPTAEETVSALGLVEKRVKVYIDASELSDVVKIGYDVNVKFISEVQLDVIAIPKTAVFYQADNAYVFKNVGGKAVMTEIKTSMDTDALIVVSSGLEAGDEIVKNYKIAGIENGKRIK
jgi:HlyD family secretion protein